MYNCRILSVIQMAYAAICHQKVCAYDKGKKLISLYMDHLFVLNAQSHLIIIQMLLDI